MGNPDSNTVTFAFSFDLAEILLKEREIFISKTPSLDLMIPSNTNKDGFVYKSTIPARGQVISVSCEVFAVAQLRITFFLDMKLHQLVTILLVHFDL